MQKSGNQRFEFTQSLKKRPDNQCSLTYRNEKRAFEEWAYCFEIQVIVKEYVFFSNSSDKKD